MVFHKTAKPCAALQPYVDSFVILETAVPVNFNLLPKTGLVAAICYQEAIGISGEAVSKTTYTHGIYGLHDAYRTLHNPAGHGMFSINFTEAGAAAFLNVSMQEMQNSIITLDLLFSAAAIADFQEQLALAAGPAERFRLANRFLLSQLKHEGEDLMVREALRIIHSTNGCIRIADLAKQLYVSQSKLERHFRYLVGTTPKKFASIVRIGRVLDQTYCNPQPTKQAYDAGYFDQAHFIREFKAFTGAPPGQFFTDNCNPFSSVPCGFLYGDDRDTAYMMFRQQLR